MRSAPAGPGRDRRGHPASVAGRLENPVAPSACTPCDTGLATRLGRVRHRGVALAIMRDASGRRLPGSEAPLSHHTATTFGRTPTTRAVEPGGLPSGRPTRAVAWCVGPPAGCSSPSERRESAPPDASRGTHPGRVGGQVGMPAAGGCARPRSVATRQAMARATGATTRHRRDDPDGRSPARTRLVAKLTAAAADFEVGDTLGDLESRMGPWWARCSGGPVPAAGDPGDCRTLVAPPVVGFDLHGVEDDDEGSRLVGRRAGRGHISRSLSAPSST